MSKPKKHAKYAASNSERWVNCPSSLSLYEWALKQPSVKVIESSSDAADEGTKAHEIMELSLESNVKNVVKMYENDIGDGFVTEAMLKHIQMYVDYVRGKMKPNYEMLVEQRVELPFLHKTEAFGTVDTAIIEPFGQIHVIDLKYGKSFVNHIKNLQMTFYALGIAHKLHFDIDSVKTTIFQPRAGDKPARSYEFSVDELMRSKEMFVEAVDRCESAKPESDLNEGKWCFFCPNKLFCPALSRGALKKAQLAFDAPLQPSPKSLTSNQLKTILDKAAYLELWVKEVKAYAEEQIRSGVKIEGWGLEPKRAQRVWAKTDKLAALSFKYGIKTLKTEHLTPAEVEKEMKAADVPKELIERFLKDNVVAVSSGDKLSKTNNELRELSLDETFTD